MKKFLLLTATAAVLAAATGCDFHHVSWSNADLTSATSMVQTGAFPAEIRFLEVDNRNGNIHIVGTEDGGSAQWSWKLTIRARNQPVAERIATNTTCTAGLVGDHFLLVVHAPNDMDAHSLQSDFEITLPKSAAARIQNHFGRVDISGLNANVDVANENGRVDITDIAGTVHARTSFDELCVSNTASATLHNQNGEIRAAAIGRSLEASTSFAPLMVADIRGSATLANQNGSIEATAVRGDLNANTSFDSLVATSINGSVRLRNQNGSIRITDIGGDADVETSFDTVQAAKIQGNALVANRNGAVSVNGVAGTVKATTSFAPIEIVGAGSKFVCNNRNGAIRLRATSPALKNIEANTSFDTIEVHLPGDLKPAIQARTSFADVASDFPVLLKPRGEDPFAGIASDVARISLDNQNGRIAIARN